MFSRFELFILLIFQLKQFYILKPIQANLKLKTIKTSYFFLQIRQYINFFCNMQYCTIIQQKCPRLTSRQLVPKQRIYFFLCDLSSYLCRSLYIICGYYMIDMSTDDQDYSSKCVLRSTFKTCVVLNCNLRFIDFPSSAYLSNIHMTTDLQLVQSDIFCLFTIVIKCHPPVKVQSCCCFLFLEFFFLNNWRCF